METPKSVLNYIELIDKKYEEAKAKRISRFDMNGWGMWSREMNLEIKSKIEDESIDKLERILLKGILPYWLTVSELLELHFKSKFLGDAKKKKLSKQRKELKDDILGGHSISEMSLHDLAIKAMQSG